MKIALTLTALAAASLLVACGGPEESAATELDSSGLARGSTTVHDGSESCAPSGPFLSCLALEGVSHSHVDGTGRQHFVFNGTRTQRLRLGGVVMAELSTEEHRNYLVDEDGVVRMHLQGCLQIDGGAVTIAFETQIAANGEVIRSESVTNEGC